eukprot:6217514-Amphidinium_carterae.1
MASRKVWYQFLPADEFDLDDVEVSNTATVNDVKAAIKEKNRMEIGLPAMRVYVNEGGEALRPDTLLEHQTNSADHPLRVVLRSMPEAPASSSQVMWA